MILYQNDTVCWKDKKKRKKGFKDTKEKGEGKSKTERKWPIIPAAWFDSSGGWERRVWPSKAMRLCCVCVCVCKYVNLYIYVRQIFLSQDSRQACVPWLTHTCHDSFKCKVLYSCKPLHSTTIDDRYSLGYRDDEKSGNGCKKKSIWFGVSTIPFLDAKLSSFKY